MSGFPGNVCGFQRVTSSGVIGDSGKPIVLTGYSVDASAGGVTTPIFYNATSADAANVAFKATTVAAASQSSTNSLPFPVMLGRGCYVGFDANTAAVTIFYIAGA